VIYSTVTHLGGELVMATLSGIQLLARETESEFSSSLRLPENDGID
jgi:hypothetical protein